jgi:hypothetical protein
MSPGFTCAACIIPESHSKPPLIFLFGIRFVPPQAQSFAAKRPCRRFRCRATDRADLKKRLSCRRWVRWFKTTNAHRAQPARVAA